MQRFKKLNLWNKTGVVGAIASIIGLIIYILLPTSPEILVRSENQQGGITANKVTINAPSLNVNTARRITKQQKLMLKKNLRNIGSSPITISISDGDSEAFQYAQQFITILEAAGCNIAHKERVVFNPQYPGLNIRISNEEISADANILFNAISKIDSKAKIIKDTRFDSGYLALIVGSMHLQ